ncbi:cytochrome c oxidase subunit VIa domain-containing protein [Phthorimaea operculella]|nr:cytochrome c oxidase subunit VIa domain-containing protein [Phthorimaea operculella]
MKPSPCKPPCLREPQPKVAYPATPWCNPGPPCPPRPCCPIPPNPCCPVLPKGNYKPYKCMFFFVCLPLIFVQIGRSLFGAHHCNHGLPCRKFEYMRRRTKRYPWGSGQETFFHNPCVNQLPEDCTDQIQMQECEDYYKLSCKKCQGDTLPDMPVCPTKEFLETTRITSNEKSMIECS